MKAILKRTIETETALELVQGIIENASFEAREDMALECRCHGACTCPARYAGSRITGEGYVYSPDYHSGNNTVTFPGPDTCLVTGEAGSGTHILRINIRTGGLTVTHDGARRSYPGNVFNILPAVWQDINRIEDWELVSSESSRPEWAVVAGFLNGQVGEGPANQEEADAILQEEELAALRRQAEAAGRELPPGLHKFNGNWADSSLTTWKPKWTGLEYRRAAANGIPL